MPYLLFPNRSQSNFVFRVDMLIWKLRFRTLWQRPVFVSSCVRRADSCNQCVDLNQVEKCCSHNYGVPLWIACCLEWLPTTIRSSMSAASLFSATSRRVITSTAVLFVSFLFARLLYAEQFLGKWLVVWLLALLSDPHSANGVHVLIFHRVTGVDANRI